MWSAHTLLRSPRFVSSEDAPGVGLEGGIAAIRLFDHLVIVNEGEVAARGLAPFGVAILAHEVGHHVYVPGNRRDHARGLAAMRRALAGLPERTSHVCMNLYADLLVNDRLQRARGVDIASVYRKLAADDAGRDSAVWGVYCRTCEHLWRLERGALGARDADATRDADAVLLASLIRSYAREWLCGAGKFASVLYPYFAADAQRQAGWWFEALGLHDTVGAGKVPEGVSGAQAIPDGLAGEDDTEGASGPGGGQARLPHEYGALLEALGLNIDKHEVTTQYYREQARPHLIPFPHRPAPAVLEPVLEGDDPWLAGEDLEALDILASLLHAPRLVPGLTTRKLRYDLTPGQERSTTPVDLDIYVDCSGSMPDPSGELSYLALAGTILAMSALRAGARVQATLWSSPGVFDTTGGFTRDSKRILGIITGYVSGGTSFPLHILRETYRSRSSQDPPAHVVVISDDGADTMLLKDEKGREGAEVCREALLSARGGGTLVLNLYAPERWSAKSVLEELGFRVHVVRAWNDLVAFSREFVRQQYTTG